MPKDPSHELDTIAEAVRHRRLAAADIAILRAHISSLQDARTEARFIRQALRDLKVAATQLKTMQAHAAPAFDEAAFEALSPHVRKRILLRLDNLSVRVVKAAADSTRPTRLPFAHDADPAFKCMRDYEAARSHLGASAFWCQMSLVVCLLRSILGLIPPLQRK